MERKPRASSALITFSLYFSLDGFSIVIITLSPACSACGSAYSLAGTLLTFVAVLAALLQTLHRTQGGGGGAGYDTCLGS